MSRLLMKKVIGNIFNSRYTIGEKVCGIIIEGDYCTNLPGRHLMKNFKFRTIILHIFFNFKDQTNEVTISRQALCHYLLVHIVMKYFVMSYLWMYVIYFSVDLSCLITMWFMMRHVNIYSLKHNGRSLTVTPLPPPKPQNIKLGKEVRKSSKRVKYEMSVPLVSASLKLPYWWSNKKHVRNWALYVHWLQFLLILVVLSSCMDSLLGIPCQGNHLSKWSQVNLVDPWMVSLLNLIDSIFHVMNISRSLTRLRKERIWGQIVLNRACLMRSKSLITCLENSLLITLIFTNWTSMILWN